MHRDAANDGEHEQNHDQRYEHEYHSPLPPLDLPYGLVPPDLPDPFGCKTPARRRMRAHARG
jgi:hypothetical protein